MAPKNETPLLGRLFAAIVSAMLLIAGLMFSVVLLAIAGVVMLIGFGYFWWQTRAIRNTRHEAPVDSPAHGQVIDGEAVVIEEPRAEKLIP
jgi:cytochrome b subunit of formate dehydrogenase